MPGAVYTEGVSSWSELLAPGTRLTFAQFMELALYHETLGYYCRQDRPHPAGPGGDFITAPSAHPAFAWTLASLLRQLAESCGKSLAFVDLGAGEGALLPFLLPLRGEGVLGSVVAVERSRESRKRLGASYPEVQVVATVEELTQPSGPAVLLASEVYDALPCHVVEQHPEGLRELFVEVKADGALAWRAFAPSTPALGQYLRQYGIELCPGQRAEIRPQAEAFHQRVLAALGEEAVVLVLDYGYPARQLYNWKARKQGSLVGYSRHQVVWDPLSRPGEVDLTAHVNWDDLVSAARTRGFASLEPEPLGLFLTRWGLFAALSQREGEGSIPWEIKALVHPAGMGSDLKVLQQGKGAIWECYVRLRNEKFSG